ncbi:autotransporter outer membrane beta-barrel domain-containing protein [Devosia sp. UYZn731]|uniref:autotransporter outer membrane beta-barrel domain-containing protein n=1 Tax=Devosia sp. UYZn731 TaxID=3156345 RepID=UPI0033997278
MRHVVGNQYDGQAAPLDVEHQFLITAFDSTLTSSLTGLNLVTGNSGRGYALSLEAGQEVQFGQHFSITLQAQLAYSAVRFNTCTDPFGAPVSLTDGDRLRGRTGVSVEYETEWQSPTGKRNSTHLDGIANLYYDFFEGPQMSVAGTPVFSRNDPLSGGVGLGGSISLNDDAVRLHGEALVTTGLSSFGTNQGFSATGGISIRW